MKERRLRAGIDWARSVGHQILVVEDEPEIAELLKLALDDEGFTADLVATAADARRFIQEWCYDVVIADWRLPDGNGLSLLDRAAARGIKTIMISGYLSLLNKPDERHAYLMKPVQLSELVATVKRLIGSEGLLQTN